MFGFLTRIAKALLTPTRKTTPQGGICCHDCGRIFSPIISAPPRCDVCYCELGGG